eukprot:CAMPEP_0196596834 /NCGR_PEP_ID=MMETSP1081-20130531/88184_1 /TAXON_ID=36882 /ORGANISM="Pyramimonas amylifera, Strain CCMP720" /LENGTH=48 /DNA_ID= /DNA_START= /DNA_END= /DNA_ORIENTATION=
MPQSDGLRHFGSGPKNLKRFPGLTASCVVREKWWGCEASAAFLWLAMA